jgi:glycosyltransferase involved in cell wall biosynthesis
MAGCPIHNRERYLSRYLASLLQLDFELRVVFLVNNSTDNTLKFLKYYKRLLNHVFGAFEVHEYADAPQINEKARDFSAYADIRNKWLELWDGEEYVFSVDSDIFVPPQTLQTLIGHKVDICSVLVENAPPSYRIYNIANYIDDELVRPLRLKEGLMPVDITGAAYLIHKSVIEAGVCYGFHQSGEDIYFCNLAFDKGFEIFCDTSVKTEHDMRERYVQ